MYSGTGVDDDHVGVVLQCLETVEKPLQLEGRNICQFFYSGSATDNFYSAGSNGYDLFKFLITGQNVSEIVIAVGVDDYVDVSKAQVGVKEENLFVIGGKADRLVYRLPVGLPATVPGRDRAGR